MIISARRTVCSIPQEKLLVKFSRWYHALMKITFAETLYYFLVVILFSKPNRVTEELLPRYGYGMIQYCT